MSVTHQVGVICPGTGDYPIHLSMETAIVFAVELGKDFIGQYYGSGQELKGIASADPSDYRRVVMTVLELLSTDSLTIVGGENIRQPALSLSIVLSTDPNTGATTPGEDSMVYLDGRHGRWKEEANIYVPSIWNLVNAVNDAVNLDLGSHGYGNLYRNATVFQQVIMPNLPPQGVSSGNWSATEDSQSFYYGKLPPQYQTWAQALLAGWPITVGAALKESPGESSMQTTYLCPMYRVKPLGSLLSSVFVGSATMILSVWSAWMFLTTFLAKKIMAPRVQCHCVECQRREDEEVRREMDHTKTGMFGKFGAWMGRTKPASGRGDEK
ncbi:hypothetical protein FRC08_007982 [Ceratobasidium sp. 394]|nr:hypothetical protein FRC08_007982 [Ceratobasidium sp. 394]